MTPLKPTNSGQDGLNPNISNGARAQMNSTRELSTEPFKVVGREFYTNNFVSTDHSKALEGFNRKDIVDIFTDSKWESICGIVKDLYLNVVALSNGKGAPFGTGLLIHPQLVITARHCIENVALAQLSIRTNFQKTFSQLPDLGEFHPIEGVLDEDSGLDYAIVLLKNPIKNMTFNHIEIDTKQHSETDNITENTLLFHHPDKSLKKVSFAPTLDSNQKMVSHSTAHDSTPGSSGGIYVTLDGKIVALHQIKNQEITNAKFISEIYQQSKLLQQFYPEGTFAPEQELKSEVIATRLEMTQASKEYHDWLEVYDKKPSNYPRANDGNKTGVLLAHHHIIPKGNMEFMWMVSKEFPSLEKTLQTITKSDSAKQVIWAKWNIFTGPAGRCTKKQLEEIRASSVTEGYDPEGNVEPLKPKSFDLSVWNDLIDLNQKIENCWSARLAISLQTREQTIKSIDEAIKNKSMPSITISGQIDSNYKAALTDLDKKLQSIVPLLLSQVIHPMHTGDWKMESTFYVLEN